MYIVEDKTCCNVISEGIYISSIYQYKSMHNQYTFISLSDKIKSIQMCHYFVRIFFLININQYLLISYIIYFYHKCIYHKTRIISNALTQYNVSYIVIQVL